jgi:SAM-dependent methyltransferase
MTTWEARVHRGTAPADRVDAELRYAFAAPVVRDAALWVDLGCGTGIAAGGAFADVRPSARAVLVDADAEALEEARRECGADVAAVVHADLETTEGTSAVREALAELAVAGPVVVTCFGVMHQLADFTALVELLIALGEAGATVILSVPDDASGALDDPHRRSAWSAGAVEELRRLLPAEAVQLRQVAVRAAAIVGEQGGPSAPLGAVDVPAHQAPTSFLLAFGPQAQRLAPASRARAADLEAERADARRRESDLAYLEARLAALEAPTAAR